LKLYFLILILFSQIYSYNYLAKLSANRHWNFFRYNFILKLSWWQHLYVREHLAVYHKHLVLSVFRDDFVAASSFEFLDG